MAEGYSNRSYRLQEAEDRCFGRSAGVGGVSMHFGLGDSLARSGRLREAIGVYAYCCRRVGAPSVPPDRLRHLASALLEAVAGVGGKRGASPTRQTSPPHRGTRASHCQGAPGSQTGGAAAVSPLPVPACFACPVCEGVLYQPVTASCGHTFCKKCLTNEGGKPCVRCGHRLNVGGPLETNVLIKSLVEKWWAPELRAVQMRDEGNELFQRNQVEAALQKYDEAVRFAPNNHLLLSNRSHALYRLNRVQEALADADSVVRLKPSWGKGHYRRGVALFSLGQYEDALMAFCTCVALDGNVHALRHEVSQVLLRILVPSGLSTRGGGHMPSSPQSSSPTSHHRLSPTLYSLCFPHSYSPPYSLSSPIRRGASQRYHSNVFNHHSSSCPLSPPHPLIPSVEVSPATQSSRSLPNPVIPQPSSPIPQLSLSSLNQLGLHSSDCEDNSSGEEDSVHTHSYQRLSLSSENARLQGMLDQLLREMEKIKRGDHKLNGNSSSPPMLSPPSRASVDSVDFDCVLCCRTLWSPVTTPCGHTYCWVCLDRCLDYSCACPLCMASLADYLATSPRSVTEFIERALWTYLPSEYETRQLIHRQELSEGGTGNCGVVGPEGIRVEPRVPVFVCTAAFPHVPCPLFVYEPRYRLMVRRCVETGGRQFGIAACISSSRRSDGLSRYADYGTMLEMRDWVLMGDGCSILSTVGVRRFRVMARGERDGYDTAQVQFIQDQPIPPEQVNGVKQLHDRVHRKSQLWLSTVGHPIRQEIERTFGVMPELEVDDSWLSMPDGPAWAWWVLAILPLGQNLQVGILATTSLEKRLRAIDKTLDHMQRQISASISASSSRNATGDSSSNQSLHTSSSQSSSEQENSSRSATEERRSSFDSES